MQYQRFVSYLYKYNGDYKDKNTGFVKLEQKGDYVRLSLRTKVFGSGEGEYGIYLIHKLQGTEVICERIEVDTLSPKMGVLTYQYITRYQPFFGTKYEFREFAGVLILGSTGDVYMTVWQDLDLVPDQIVPEVEMDMTSSIMQDLEIAAAREESEQEGAVTEKTVEQEVVEEEIAKEELAEEEFVEEDLVKEELAKERSELTGLDIMEERSEQIEAEDGATYLFSKRAKLPLVEGSQLFDCVRIVPQDIGRLDMRNWKYGNNSFLSHGYYRYRYLLLGKLRFQDDAEKIILGVPSVYDNREQYLANLFGFEQFISVKRTDQKQGQFGYWIVELAQNTES